MRRACRFALPLLLVPLAGCAGPCRPRPAVVGWPVAPSRVVRSQPSPRVLPSERRAARRYGLGMPAVWSYLAATYDRDRDGHVTPEEYRRDAKTFERLDRDHDGVLTFSDFRGPAHMDQLIARLVLLRYLRPPGGEDPLDAAGLAAGFARRDLDAHGRLGREEIDRALASHEPMSSDAPPEMPRGVHVYDSLLALLDTDGSRDLSLAEIDAWRARLATREQAMRSEHDRPLPAPHEEGPEVGSKAPDLTLTRLADGSRIRLLELLGTKPVALVFGSWT